MRKVDLSRPFAVWKPKGPTSNDILNKIRRALGTKKVGHAGTLDPLAEGILVVGVGRQANKQLSEIVGDEKEYIATVKLGQTSTTDDEEGEKTNYQLPKWPGMEQVREVLSRFVGKIMQIPPIYSAIKVKGKEAYKYARKGSVVELKPREVEIKKIELLSYSPPLLKIKVITGKGVYIRSLARDIGEVLGTGAYLADLIRTRVGIFDQNVAISISNLDRILESDS